MIVTTSIMDLSSYRWLQKRDNKSLETRRGCCKEDIPLRATAVYYFLHAVFTIIFFCIFALKVEEVENDEPKFEDKLQNLTSDALEEEDVVKDELFEDKMIPNPQVGVPYYLAFMMFNEEVEEHWMLTSTTTTSPVLLID